MKKKTITNIIFNGKILPICPLKIGNKTRMLNYTRDPIQCNKAKDQKALRL